MPDFLVIIISPCEFWLWLYFKSIVYQGHAHDTATNIVISFLKDQIIIQIRQINADMLHGLVTNVVYRLHLLEHQNDSDVKHICNLR